MRGALMKQLRIFRLPEHFRKQRCWVKGVTAIRLPGNDQFLHQRRHRRFNFTRGNPRYVLRGQDDAKPSCEAHDRICVMQPLEQLQQPLSVIFGHERQISLFVREEALQLTHRIARAELDVVCAILLPQRSLGSARMINGYRRLRHDASNQTFQGDLSFRAPTPN